MLKRKLWRVGGYEKVWRGKLNLQGRFIGGELNGHNFTKKLLILLVSLGFQLKSMACDN